MIYVAFTHEPDNGADNVGVSGMAEGREVDDGMDIGRRAPILTSLTIG